MTPFHLDTPLRMAGTVNMSDGLHKHCFTTYCKDTSHKLSQDNNVIVEARNSLGLCHRKILIVDHPNSRCALHKEKMVYFNYCP